MQLWLELVFRFVNGTTDLYFLWDQSISMSSSYVHCLTFTGITHGSVYLWLCSVNNTSLLLFFWGVIFRETLLGSLCHFVLSLEGAR